MGECAATNAAHNPHSEMLQRTLLEMAGPLARMRGNTEVKNPRRVNRSFSPSTWRNPRCSTCESDSTIRRESIRWSDQIGALSDAEDDSVAANADKFNNVQQIQEYWWLVSY